MGGCCGKREPVPGQANTTTTIGGITSNEVPKLIEYTNSFFT